MVDMAMAERGSGEQRHQRIKQQLSEYLLGEVRAHGCQLAESVVLEILETDLELNAQGMGVWLDGLPA
jgi:hypothetical protein